MAGDIVDEKQRRVFSRSIKIQRAGNIWQPNAGKDSLQNDWKFLALTTAKTATLFDRLDDNTAPFVQFSRWRRRHQSRHHRGNPVKGPSMRTGAGAVVVVDLGGPLLVRHVRPVVSVETGCGLDLLLVDVEREAFAYGVECECCQGTA